MAVTSVLESISKLLKGNDIDVTTLTDFLRVTTSGEGIDDVVKNWIQDNIETILSPSFEAVQTEIIDTLSEAIVDSLDIFDFTNNFSNILDGISNLSDLFQPNGLLNLLNLGDAQKNVLINIFVNPILKKLPFINPSDAPIYAHYVDGELKVDTESLFSTGHYYLGTLFYRAIRNVYNAIYEVIIESADWFNEHVAGSEIKFPIPLFSGKAIQIATKVGEVWEPNPNLVMPEIDVDDFDAVLEKYPWLDVFPFNTKIPDAKMFSNGILKKNIDGQWDDADGYYRSDLAFDILCTVVVAFLTYTMIRIGWKHHVDKFNRKMLKAMELNKNSQYLYNNITYKNGSNKALMYILMLLTRGSSVNKGNLNVSLGNITGLEDIFEGLTAMEDDTTLDTEIKALVVELKSLLVSGYRPYG